MTVFELFSCRLRRVARSLAFLSAISIIAMAVSIFFHQRQKMQTLMDGIKEPVRQALITGNQFELNRLLGSVARSASVQTVLFDSFGKRKLKKQGSESDLLFYIFSIESSLGLVEEGNSLGKLKINYPFPMENLLFILVSFAIMILFFASQASKALQESSKELSKPIISLAQEIDQVSPEKPELDKVQGGKIEIKELDHIRDKVSSLLAKIAEAERRKSVDLKNAMMAKVTANMRHDAGQLQMVMDSVMGSIRRQPESVKKPLEKHLHMLDEVFQRLTSMIKEVPRISLDQIEESYPELIDVSVETSGEHCELNQVVGSVVEQFQTYLKSHQENISIHFAPNPCNMKIGISREDLSRILLNLLKNAEEALIFDGGQIHVMVDSFKDQAVIKVIDEGAGFTPEKLKLIENERFTDKAFGSGIGLSSCRGILQKWHGRLSLANNSDGKGALVSVHLPLLQEISAFVENPKTAFPKI